MYLIDTNIVSEARRGTKEAVSWLRSVDPLSVFLSVVTLGEVMLASSSSKSRIRGPQPA
jgi:toxin FitB